MKIVITLLILILFPTLAAFGEEDYLTYRLSENGYGPVKIGMSVQEAQKVLGVPLIPEHEIKGKVDYCYYVLPNGEFSNLGFMVEEQKITRIDIRGKTIETVDGAKIGNTIEEIKKIYGKSLRIEPHPYTGPEEKYLIVSKGKNFELIFETENQKVIEFRCGKLPSVEYIERCL